MGCCCIIAWPVIQILFLNTKKISLFPLDLTFISRGAVGIQPIRETKHMTQKEQQPDYDHNKTCEMACSGVRA